ncbi:MAG TPA: hypothetical protein VGN27_07205 [Gaiellaceae bacterium]|jgi:hypothetical protein|nr:hypothetical protein [Gaiellaceae bacterium]
MLASSSTALSIIFLVVVIAGVVVTIGIYWFGLRSARRHDERHGR